FLPSRPPPAVQSARSDYAFKNKPINCCQSDGASTRLVPTRSTSTGPAGVDVRSVDGGEASRPPAARGRSETEGAVRSGPGSHSAQRASVGSTEASSGPGQAPGMSRGSRIGTGKQPGPSP